MKTFAEIHARLNQIMLTGITPDGGLSPAGYDNLTALRQDLESLADDERRDAGLAAKAEFMKDQRIAGHRGWTAYAEEAEHGDGYGYWLQFATVDALLEDLEMYTRIGEEDGDVDDDNPRVSSADTDAALAENEWDRKRDDRLTDDADETNHEEA